MSRRSGLGRGLAALIPPSPPPAPGTDAADEDDAPRGDEVHPPAPEDPEGTVDADASAADAAADGHLGAPARTDGETDPDTEGRVTTAGSATDIAPRRDVASDDPGTTHEAEASARGERSATPAPPSGVIAPSAATLAEIDPAMIVPNPRQPREVFDPEEIEGLAISLSDIGVLQPLVVRPAADGRFELIAGERRLRAAKLAGLARVPAVVRHTDDTEMLKEALVENIHRVQLNPLEEAAAYQQLLEEFGVTQDELAASLGRSRPAISNAIRLLQLPTDVQRRVAAGVLSAGHAKALLALEDPTTQARLADRIVAEGLSVRATEELIRLRLLEDDDRERGGSKRRRATTAPGLIELQEDLSDALEARVRISMGVRKGKLAIEFASVDDLERIVGVIANGLGGNAGATSGLLEPSEVEDAPQGVDGTPEPPHGRGG